MAAVYSGIEKSLEDLGFGKSKPADWLGKDLIARITPGIRSGVDYAVGLEPGRQSTINNALLANSPGNVAAQTQRGVGELLNMGQQQGDQQAASLRAQGFGKEYQESARLASAGTAQRQANQLVSTENDRMNKAYMNALAIIQMGQQHPLFPMAQQLMQMVEASRQGHLNRQQQGQGGGLGGVLGSVAGSILGGPIGGAIGGSIFGGGGGSSAGSGVGGAIGSGASDWGWLTNMR